MLVFTTAGYCVECDCGTCFERDIDRYCDTTVACPRCGKEWTY